MRLARFAGTLLALLGMSAAAHAAAVLQSGPWLPGHAPMYSAGGASQPVVQDSGPAGGGPTGVGLSEGLFVARGTGNPPFVGAGTGPLGANICDYDAPVTNPTGYHFLCWTADAITGHGLIEYGAGGGATPSILDFVINGVTYPFANLIITEGVSQNQMRAWASANGSPLYIFTIEGACPSDISNLVNVQWMHGNSMVSGDPLYNFIESTLGFTGLQMATAYTAMLSYPR
jgi:hypothetical protein